MTNNSRFYTKIFLLKTPIHQKL